MIASLRRTIYDQEEQNRVQPCIEKAELCRQLQFIDTTVNINNG